MSQTRVTALRAGLILATAAVAACSAGPSEAEIVAAIEKHLPDMSLGGERMMEVTRVRKLGCNSADGGYHCDVEWTLKALGQEQSQAQRLRFVKGSDGWVVTGPAAS